MTFCTKISDRPDHVVYPFTVAHRCVRSGVVPAYPYILDSRYRVDAVLGHSTQ